MGGLDDGDEGLDDKMSPKIIDRRGSPNKADHGRVVNSFQQGLACVSTVHLYDVETHHEFMEEERHGIIKSYFKALGMVCSSCCGRLWGAVGPAIHRRIH